MESGKDKESERKEVGKSLRKGEKGKGERRDGTGNITKEYFATRNAW